MTSEELEAASTIRALVEELYEIKLAAAGGEDVAGSANAVTPDDVRRWAKDQEQRERALEAKLREAVKVIKRFAEHPAAAYFLATMEKPRE